MIASLLKPQYITHPYATGNIPTHRVLVRAQAFEGSQATSQIETFDLLCPIHVCDRDGFGRTIERARSGRWNVLEFSLTKDEF